MNVERKLELIRSPDAPYSPYRNKKTGQKAWILEHPQLSGVYIGTPLGLLPGDRMGAAEVIFAEELAADWEPIDLPRPLWIDGSVYP